MFDTESKATRQHMLFPPLLTLQIRPNQQIRTSKRCMPHTPMFLWAGCRKSETNKAGTVAKSETILELQDGTFVPTNHLVLRERDELVPWYRYAVLDGELAIIYEITFDARLESPDIMRSWCDAKELDPKYRKTILEAEGQALEKMKLENRFPVRAGRRFNELKKLELKYRGIDWRAPWELTPPKGRGVRPSVSISWPHGRAT